MSGGGSFFVGTRGRWATPLPVDLDASINWAAASFTYAVRTVPRYAQLGAEILPWRQTRTGRQHAIVDGCAYSPADLLG